MADALGGEYEILRLLGSGGAGSVYLAREIALERRVAIKVLNRAMAGQSDAPERFLREARGGASLVHPNVCTVYRLGRLPDGLPYMVMEYVEGRTLQDRLDRRGGRLEPAEAIAMVSAMAEGLAAAHAKGIVHRDLKPSNVLVEEATGHPKIVDFGIATIAEGPDSVSRLTQTGFLVGTPEYMSPEQLTGDPVTYATDVYSLGLILFRVLAGEPAFDGRTQTQIITERLIGSPRRLDQRAPWLEPQWVQYLQPVLDRALARDAEQRYGDAATFAKALGGIRAELGVSAHGVPADVRSPERDDGPARAASPTRFETARPAQSSPFPSIGWIRLAPLVGLWRGLVDLVARTLDSFGALVRSPENRAGEAGAAARPRATLPPSRPGPDQEPTGGRSRPIHSSPPQPTVPAQPEATALFPASEWSAPEAPAADPQAMPAEYTQLFVLDRPNATTEALDLPVALTVSATGDTGQIGRQVACSRFPFTVGRSDEASLPLRGDPLLSRIHVEITRTEDGYFIRDLSTNGAYLDGRRMSSEAEPLRFGASISLSENTKLLFSADLPELPVLEGTVLNARYELREVLHRSVKGSLYRAADLSLEDRPLAVKVFSPSLDSLGNYRQQFLRQARLASKLVHPHVCKILDHGRAPIVLHGASVELPFLCMELMEGGSLPGRLGEGPSLAQVGRWVTALAGALDHAHRKGVVHGDLKPTCIVFDSDHNAYLSDFALGSGDRPGGTSTVFGTPAYLAPERWEGEPPSEAADQFAFAALTYLMVTGSRPYEGQSDPEVRRRNFQRPPTPAHHEAERMGRDPVTLGVSEVLARGLSVAPGDRFESVSAFNEAFQRAMRDTRDPNRTPRVFLSYRRAVSGGSLAALLLKERLEEDHGCSVFVDTRAIDGAPTIPERIREEIDRADVFVCLLAPETLGSDWVRQEIEMAGRGAKPMVPIFQEGFEPPSHDGAAEPGLQTLLTFEAVKLLDRQGLYVDAAIALLGDRIKRLV